MIVSRYLLVSCILRKGWSSFTQCIKDRVSSIPLRLVWKKRRTFWTKVASSVMISHGVKPYFLLYRPWTFPKWGPQTQRHTSSSSIRFVFIEYYFSNLTFNKKYKLKHLYTLKNRIYICIILQKSVFVQQKSVFLLSMDLCLNSVRIETPNINEIFFLNCSKYLGLQLWSEDRLQIAGSRWQFTGNGWPVTGVKWHVTGDRW